MKPSHMSDEQWEEYKLTEEYKQTVFTVDAYLESYDESEEYDIDGFQLGYNMVDLPDNIDNVISIINNSEMSDVDKEYCVGVMLSSQDFIRRSVAK